MPAAAQPASSDSAAVFTYLAGLDKAQRLAVLKKEGAREGKLTIYGAIAIERGQILLDLFHKQYPDIKADFVRLTTTDLPQRMTIEQRASRVTADVGIVTSDRLQIMSSAIAPYKPTTWADYDPRFRIGDEHNTWAATNYELLVEAIAWRSDRVTKEEAPKSLDEVSQPKWKGRTGTVTSLEHLLDSYTTMYGEDAGLKKVQALAALDNRLYPSIAGLSEGVGAGQIDVAWGVSAMRAIRLKKSGAPVDFVYQDPAFGIPDAVFVAQGAGHPYAAALFVEFLTSASTLETLDKMEPGMTFGNLKGNFERPLASFPNLVIYRPIPDAKYREENRTIERLFIRRK
jgi:iron(III) transport system substrate-binding protein